MMKNRRIKQKRVFFAFLSIFCLIPAVRCPDIGYCGELSDITPSIQQWKKDPKGPYEAIRWFCPDGRVLPPDQPCGGPGGFQHAVPKEVVQRLTGRGIYLGQILAGTDAEAFLDRGGWYERIKQYQIEHYLAGVDDGWIFRRARYYRGAVQVEDESDWSREFLVYCLTDRQLVSSQFFLLFQAAKTLPSNGADAQWLFIRSQSKAIADTLPAFNDLRIKLHGRPEPLDVVRVKAFRAQQAPSLDPAVDAMLAELIVALERAYSQDPFQIFEHYAGLLPKNSPGRTLLTRVLDRRATAGGDQGYADIAYLRQLADLMWLLRLDILDGRYSKKSLAMLNLSVQVEDVLFRELNGLEVHSLERLLECIALAAKACAGSGLLEVAEWQRIEAGLSFETTDRTISLNRLAALGEHGRRVVEWGAGMIRAVYGPSVKLFSDFEPLAAGFIDDRVRSSLLLPLGDLTGRLHTVTVDLSGRPAAGGPWLDPAGVRGLNPGFALGELQAPDIDPGAIRFSDQGIYFLEHAPADLKPVAGIATVSEGNLVSHVQLLARNLGIPNAVISAENLAAVKAHGGQRVFYAVSPKGAVVLKPETAMTDAEKALVVKKTRSEARVAVPTDRLDLELTQPVALTDVSARDSGRICGPKAANLGQLKRIFPEYIGNGLVLPFGIFRRHMDQAMPGAPDSYWAYLHQTFAEAEARIRQGEAAALVDAFMLERLARLREAIATMALLPEFRRQLGAGFETQLGAPLGELPVFVRSDTNMEDLKDFTGAGLNLTVFNVRDQEKIYQAIRDVWASPYTERSYRWRQKFLLNPENVFPSILILPTVNVESSGVMIIRPEGDATVAFSRGAGGAVEGQAAETYAMDRNGGVRLLAPSREVQFNVLPDTGGVSKARASFETPVLDAGQPEMLHRLAAVIQERMASVLPEAGGAFDVEVGFYNGEIRLFQARPFVENKNARSSAYLNSLDPPPADDRFIDLEMTLKP